MDLCIQHLRNICVGNRPHEMQDALNLTAHQPFVLPLFYSHPSSAIPSNALLNLRAHLLVCHHEPVGNSVNIWAKFSHLVMRGACSVDGSSACRALSRRLTAPAKRAVQAQAVASEPGRAQPTKQTDAASVAADPTSVPRIPGIKDGARRAALWLF